MNNVNSTASSSMKRLIIQMGAIITGMFIVYLDLTVINVILPRFIDDFQSTYTSAQWTITGYSLAQAAVIPLAGYLSDRFGAKRIFLLSIGWFGAGSILCALSSSIEQLVLFRIVQGVGGSSTLKVTIHKIKTAEMPSSKTDAFLFCDLYRQELTDEGKDPRDRLLSTDQIRYNLT